LIVEFLDIDEFLPQRYKHYKMLTFLGVQNTFFDDMKYWDLSFEEKAVYLALLCFRNYQNRDNIYIRPKIYCERLGIKLAIFQSTIKKLKKMKLVNVQDEKDDIEAKMILKKQTQKEMSKSKRKCKSFTPTGAEILQQLWNDNCMELPSCTKLTASRIRAGNARWCDKPDKEYWTSLIKFLANNAFYSGKASPEAWKANFDFLVRKDKHIELHEKINKNKHNGKSLILGKESCLKEESLI